MCLAKIWLVWNNGVEGSVMNMWEKKAEQLLLRQEYSPPSGSSGERREEEWEENVKPNLIAPLLHKCTADETGLKVFNGKMRPKWNYTHLSDSLSLMLTRGRGEDE